MTPTNPMPIQPVPIGEGYGRLRDVPRETGAVGARGDRGEGTRSFVETLEDSIQQVNQLQEQADEAIEGIVTGENTDIAQTMVAVQKASLSFQLITQVRNKIVEAYEDVMRMPV